MHIQSVLCLAVSWVMLSASTVLAERQCATTAVLGMSPVCLCGVTTKCYHPHLLTLQGMQHVASRPSLSVLLVLKSPCVAADTGMPSGGLHVEPRSLDTISEAASADTPVSRAPPPPAGGGSAEGPTSAGESPHAQGSTSRRCILPWFDKLLSVIQRNLQ